MIIVGILIFIELCFIEDRLNKILKELKGDDEE